MAIEMVRLSVFTRSFESALTRAFQTALLSDAWLNQSILLFCVLPLHIPTPIAFLDVPRFSDFDVLSRLAPQIGRQLTSDDLVAVPELYYDLTRMCERDAQRGVNVIIDDEYR